MAISLDSESVAPPSDREKPERDKSPRPPALSRHALRSSAAYPPQKATPPPDPPPPSAGPARSAPHGGAQARVRETFWNVPNTITTLRALVVPVLLLHPLFPGETGSTLMAWFFIAAAVSDLVDGWLARRGQQVTHIGKLLDPLADKLLASTALIVLLAMGRIPEWAVWMVVTIVGRELAVTGLRGIASAGGQVMAASGLGKFKTVMQNVAIGALLFHYETLGLDANLVGLACLGLATVLTIASGYRYFAQYFRDLDQGTGAGR